MNRYFFSVAYNSCFLRQTYQVSGGFTSSDSVSKRNHMRFSEPEQAALYQWRLLCFRIGNCDIDFSRPLFRPQWSVKNLGLPRGQWF
jgi:hypothetical protein